MGFDEIGKALGISRSGAWNHYNSALRKLRKQKGALEVLVALAREVQRARDRAEIVEVVR